MAAEFDLAFWEILVAGDLNGVREWLACHRRHVNMRRDGRTPLMVACEHGHEPVARLLLDSRADVNLTDHAGIGPLFLACLGGHETVARLLLDRGAQKETTIVGDNEGDGAGDTALMAACLGGHEAIARLLLDEGAYIDAVNAEGSTPLVTACMTGCEAVARLLLDRGADKEKRRHDGSSPLFTACLRNHEGIARLLLTRDVNINACMNNGSTPLIAACYKRNEAIVRLLLQAGADMEITTATGSGAVSAQSALTVACMLSNDGAIPRLLLQRGAASTPEKATKYRPSSNAVLGVWNALSQARREAVRRYDRWDYVAMPDEWTVQNHAQTVPHLQRHVAAICIAWQIPLEAFNRKPGDLAHRMAEALYEKMGYTATGNE